jgi:hypothetical protein
MTNEETFDGNPDNTAWKSSLFQRTLLIARFCSDKKNQTAQYPYYTMHFFEQFH